MPTIRLNNKVMAEERILMPIKQKLQFLNKKQKLKYLLGFKTYFFYLRIYNDEELYNIPDFDDYELQMEEFPNFLNPIWWIGLLLWLIGRSFNLLAELIDYLSQGKTFIMNLHNSEVKKLEIRKRVNKIKEIYEKSTKSSSRN